MTTEPAADGSTLSRAGSAGPQQRDAGSGQGRSLAGLAGRTEARIALGRSGSGVPTREVLRFQADHAMARDAVHTVFDVARIEAGCARAGLRPVVVDTQASDTAAFLRFPAAGRRLAAGSADILAELASDPVGAVGPDSMVFIVSGGLSALGVNQYAPDILSRTAGLLADRGIMVGPVVIAARGRVGLMNEIGEILTPAASTMLVGERPGLSSADSVGAYFQYRPRAGMTDAQRNCISNIRPGGLSVAAGSEALADLIERGMAQSVSGTELKG